MIFGDPLKFAISVEEVSSWTVGSFSNGILSFIVGGRRFSSSSYNVELGSEISSLNHLKCLAISPENQKIYAMDTIKAFDVLENITYPQSLEVDNDYSYLISTIGLIDCGYHFYLLNGKTDARLIYGCTKREQEFFELRLEKGFIESVIKEVVDNA